MSSLDSLLLSCLYRAEKRALLSSVPEASLNKGLRERKEESRTFVLHTRPSLCEGIHHVCSAKNNIWSTAATNKYWKTCKGKTAQVISKVKQFNLVDPWINFDLFFGLYAQNCRYECSSWHNADCQFWERTRVVITPLSVKARCLILSLCRFNCM